MPILICEKRLRLTGDDAARYCQDTGRTNLPTTISEYNEGIEDAIQFWRNVDGPESKLLAVLFEELLIRTANK